MASDLQKFEAFFVVRESADATLRHRVSNQLLIRPGGARGATSRRALPSNSCTATKNGVIDHEKYDGPDDSHQNTVDVHAGNAGHAEGLE